MKDTTRWYSERLRQEATLVRWGTFGTPVLLFPTAGGDAEEVERFHLIGALMPLISAGRIKVYSCDSVAGRTWLEGVPPRHGAWIQNQFHNYVRYEVIPAIRNDCRMPDIPVLTAGASLGAFNALAVLCRFPDAFSRAICMSGTYNMERFAGGDFSEDLYFSSPLHFVPGLTDEDVSALRNKFVILASGQGRAEDIGESWRMADVLGRKGIPNRVDAWGAEWHHDWPTWRRMLPHYLEELL
jgi:esterase/lipase superfamily enzyme